MDSNIYLLILLKVENSTYFKNKVVLTRVKSQLKKLYINITQV